VDDLTIGVVMVPNELAVAEHFRLLASENRPDAGMAFEILAGERQVPHDTDKAFYRRLCRAVLEDAVDQVEIRRTGKAVFWPIPQSECTNIPRHNTPNNRIFPPAEILDGPNMLQSKVSYHQT